MKYSDTFYENLLLEDYSTILAFTLDTNELVGVATARISDELVYDRSVMGCGGEVEGYIMTLGVTAAMRGMGLGSQLLEAIMDRMLERNG